MQYRYLIPLAVFFIFSCNRIFEINIDSDPPYNGVGSVCNSELDCREGLACVDSICQPTGDGSFHDPCILSDDCSVGLYCNSEGECAPAGYKGIDEACDKTHECKKGLICAISVEKTALVCQPAGSYDVGQACVSSLDCLAGLVCHFSSENVFGLSLCTAPGEGITDAPPFWPGSDCYDEDEQPVVYFHIPRDSDKRGDAEFFRLPFPNDIRLSKEGVDLRGFPDPNVFKQVEPIFENLNFLTHYIQETEKIKGFSTNPVIYFRFSAPFSEKTADPRSSPPAIRVVDITPDSPNYGEEVPISTFNASGGRTTRYLCPNWIAIRPSLGITLKPSTTYAAILNRNIKTITGQRFERSADLDLMLNDKQPKDTALRNAHKAYQPLREFIGSGRQKESDILNAAVFTTQELYAEIEGIRSVIREGPIPPSSPFTVCDRNVSSPCQTTEPDGSIRGACSPKHDDFIELHGKIALPNFQIGVPPYQDYDELGTGGIAVDSDGVPIVQSTLDVCFALTIPRTAEPPYPLLIVAHGTGGSFKAAIEQGKAATLSKGEPPFEVRAATLAIDMPQHGARRGASPRSPDMLFYNFLNPNAARHNITQGSSDLIALVYWAQTYRGSVIVEDEQKEIFFDPDRLVLFAHSQGATHASLMVPFEPDLFAVVLSGNGGDLSLSMLNKTQPYDIPYAISMMFADPDLCPIGHGRNCVGEMHPAIALVQTLFDNVDPINYASLLSNEPGRHLFMTYGRNDTYSPNATMKAFAKAGEIPIVMPDLEDLSADLQLPIEPPGLAGNKTSDERRVTFGLRQYLPTSDCEDGHFISTCTDQGESDTLRFILQALRGQTPQIGTSLR